MAFTIPMLGGYILEWFTFLLFLGLSLSRRRTERRFSSCFEVLILSVLIGIAGATWVLTNHPLGIDIGFYVKALSGFAQAPLSFYTNYAPYTYPPLQLYLSVIPYLLTLSPFYSLWVVSIIANLASGLLLYLVLGRGLKGLIGAGLLLFNPYYAQYSILNLTSEALITPFVLLALLFIRKRDSTSGLFLGISALAKQQALFPIFALFLKRLFENRRQSLKLLVSSALAFVLLSLPFLLSTPSEYLSMLIGRPLQYQSLTPSSSSGGEPAFATFWSAMSWISSTTGINLNTVQAVRPLVWFILIGLVIFVLFRRGINNSCYTSVLGYIPYILASNFAGGWYLVVFIPLLIPVYLDTSIRRSERATALFMILAMLPYRLADNYSLLTGEFPPYVFGDILLGLASLCFILLAVYSCLGHRQSVISPMRYSLN